MKILKKFGLATAILLAGVTVAQAQEPDVSKLDEYFKNQIAQKKSPSISVAIVKSGKVVYAKGFGFADLENEIAARPETVYRLGSITKQFTATMIMQLVGEGKVKLDDGFRKLVPEAPEAWDKVTVRQLLNHTSGIKSYTEVKGLFEDAAMKPTTPAGILKTVEKAPLDFTPGSDWNYNNTGYEILGMIIEKLDGRPYAESLQARILKPLDMTSTYFVSERTLIKGRARGYESDGKGGVKHAQYLNMDWPYAAGSMESTVLDLAKWDAALYGEKILPKSALKEMWTRTKLTDGKVRDYGFGWELHNINNSELVEHGGGIHGFATYIRRVPSKELTVIVLLNEGGANPQAVAVDAMGLVDSSLKNVAPKAIVDKDPEFTKFAKATLQSILDGKLDRAKLTPEMDKRISPEMEKSVKEMLGSLGPISLFELVSEQVKDGGKIRSYSVKIGDTMLKMSLAVDGAGKITGLNLMPG